MTVARSLLRARSTSTSAALTVPRSVRIITCQSPSVTGSGSGGPSSGSSTTSFPGFASSRATRLRTKALVSFPMKRFAYAICDGDESITAWPES